MTKQEEQLHLKIHELEKQVERLQVELKKNSETQYGLRWMDVPEAFETESENKIPTLEEVKELAIDNNDGKPTHILIEGDNYHALTCLNYTHKGKVDVIYIDPPYNTGSDGFVYKDKRVLDKFPDGTTVPTDHPLRHSYWLSFMEKRLRLAKNLMSDKGVMYISIDDNEFYNLKILCDSIFGKESFITVFPRLTTKSGKTPINFMVSHDYVLCYAKRKDLFRGVDFIDNSYKFEDEFVELRGPYNLKQPLDCNSISYSKSLDYIIEHDGVLYYPGGDKKKFFERQEGKHLPKDYAWRWSKELYEFGLANGWIVFKNGRIYTKGYLNASIEKDGDGYEISYRDKERKRSTIDFISNEYSNDIAKKQLAYFGIEKKFDFPKPYNLIFDLIESHVQKNSLTVLDFFAGSGSTGQAVLELNKLGRGHQCILVQTPEENICREVTYERNKRSICGFQTPKGVKVDGIGGSLKFYKTTFVGDHYVEHATDADKVALTQKAGCLLALGENTLDEVVTARSYQIFKRRGGDRSANGFEYTAVYFSGNLLQFCKFREEIEKLQQSEDHPRIAVYVFCWGDATIFENEFDDLRGVTIKSIPQPILEIYENLNNL